MIYIPIGDVVRVTTLNTVFEPTPPSSRFDALQVTVETENVRYTISIAGQNPAAGGVGFLLTPGTWILENSHPTTFRFIEESAGAVLNYVFLEQRPGDVHQV